MLVFYSLCGLDNPFLLHHFFTDPTQRTAVVLVEKSDGSKSVKTDCPEAREDDIKPPDLSFPFK
jgi:hypothetical protein